MLLTQNSSTFFDGENVVSTNFVYSDWKVGRGDQNVVQFGSDQLSATFLTLRIEGKFQGVDRAASLFVGNVSATNLDSYTVVTPQFTFIRVGVKANNDASPNLFNAYLLRTELIKG